MRRNVAGQFVAAQLITAADGSAFTGAVTVYVTGDAGTQAAGATGSGACTHEGNGLHSYAPSQGETNYTHVCFTFTGTGAIPTTVQIYPLAYNSSGQMEVDAVKISGDATAADNLEAAADGTGYNLGNGSIVAASVTGNVGGNVTGSVGSVATDGITSTSLAASAVTEIQAGLSTLDAAGVRSAVGLASANLDTQLTAIDDYLDTEVAAIKAKTDNLPADPADASDIAASFTTVNSKLDTIDDFLDTEVAAIKAKTDNLPAAPAAVGDIPTAVENADALLNRDMSTGTDSGSPTVRTVRQALRFLRNKWSISGTTLTVTKEDDSTASWTATVSTSAGADPVVGSDPA